jgi:hypothetical protein
MHYFTTNNIRPRSIVYKGRVLHILFYLLVNPKPHPPGCCITTLSYWRVRKRGTPRRFQNINLSSASQSSARTVSNNEEGSAWPLISRWEEVRNGVKMRPVQAWVVPVVALTHFGDWCSFRSPVLCDIGICYCAGSANVGEIRLTHKLQYKFVSYYRYTPAYRSPTAQTGRHSSSKSWLYSSIRNQF